jgi:hypothetical protein
MKTLPLLLTALSLAVLTAGGEDSAKYQTNADCGAGESCMAEACAEATMLSGLAIRLDPPLKLGAPLT